MLYVCVSEANRLPSYYESKIKKNNSYENTRYSLNVKNRLFIQECDNYEESLQHVDAR